jgi:hypothetical protein
MHFPEPWADYTEKESENVEVEGELNEDSKASQIQKVRKKDSLGVKDLKMSVMN